MPVTRPVAASRNSRSTIDDDEETQQAGRSTTNLHAQASAHGMRQMSRNQSRESIPTSSTSSHASRSSDPSNPTSQSRENVVPRLELNTQPNALISTSSNGSGDLLQHSPLDELPPSSYRPDSSKRSSILSSRDGGLLSPGGSATPFLPRTSNSRLDTASTVSSRPNAPLLGGDPFATRNNSQLDVNNIIPLPRYRSATNLAVGVSSAELANRLSNPFRDDRRARSPLGSATPVLLGTPPLQNGIFNNEKSTASSVSAIPIRSAPAFINNADPEKMLSVPYADEHSTLQSMYTDQKEDDDDMHMPQWDDDAKYRPSWKDRFAKKNVVDTIGMLFMIIGLLCVFVVLPVVSFTGTSLIPYTYETPLEQMPGYRAPSPAWARVNDKVYPLLRNIRRGLIDPDTPASAMTRKSTDGSDLVLVYSDEFNKPNRTFYPGDDPFWFAPDFWYGATRDLEWYDPDAATTAGGTLRLQLDKFPNHGLDYRSGMLNSWNQLCFKGGAFEVSVSLPGPAGKHALWPGMWSMGNLGRPGYLATTDGVWPYTYDSCDAGITPNQSMTDGTSRLPGQRLSSCTCPGEDHPTPGRGRGAPEIDIAEVSADYGGMNVAVATQSYQVAPMDIWYYPNYEFMQTPNYSTSVVNTWVGGPFQQAVSTTSMLNNKWFDGKQFQKYAYEYKPGDDENAFVAWYVGDQETMKFDARAIGPNGNIGQRVIAEEPLSLILNLGFSRNWVDIDFASVFFPTVMQIDYVRWYQPKDARMVTCDPPGYETTEYIKNHPEAYNNPNLTLWDETPYAWPKNKLMHGCKA